MTVIDSASGERRPRILISAYACGPDSGPEASAGWAIAKAAAVTGDVWIITRERFRDALSRALAVDPDLANHVHVTHIDLSPRILRWKKHGWDLYWYYALWQRLLGRTAVRMHAEIGFDIAHHVTFANDWLPSGLSRLDVPTVWGPVGGASQVPIAALRRWLGFRGTVTELLRAALTSLPRAVWGDSAARHAAVVVAQNPGVAHRFRHARSVVVEPNAAFGDEIPPHRGSATGRTAVFAGRLLAWKGAALAIEAIAAPAADGWSLRILGEGYELNRLQRLVTRLGLTDRVEFLGHLPRAKTLDALAGADALLFPSMHDQAGWIVGEASAMGLPVVCLDLGGPPTLAHINGRVVSARSADLPGQLASRLAASSSTPGTPHQRWSAARLPAVVREWYSEVLDGRSGAPAPDAGRIRVLESFRQPKNTTNPYITQLFRSLNEVAQVTPFRPAAALAGRYDVVHLHWPEVLMGGHNWRGRSVRRAVTALLLARWRLTRVPIVRTVHNLERPTNINAVDNWLLDRMDRMTTLDIRLNDRTPQRGGIPGVTIKHGHYRDWFATFPGSAPIPGRVGYVGLIRRYKGVEDLVRAFTGLAGPTNSLHIAGRPSTPELIEELVLAADGDPRVTIDPRFLDDAELVSAITASELVVLPYRHMHNSGTALAALSLDRPVLVPDNQVNRDLASEVGPGWISLFEGSLTAGALRDALSATALRSGRPDLSEREWRTSRDLHLAAFRQAISLAARRASRA